MEKAAWERGERDVMESLSVGPFEVSPTFLDLQPMDTFTISVAFRPEVAGPATAELILVCDNCQLKELMLAGSAALSSSTLNPLTDSRRSLSTMAPQLKNRSTSTRSACSRSRNPSSASPTRLPYP